MSESVMVVEDDPDMAEELIDALGTMGYEVTGTAASAHECLEVAEKHRPDLVLMDVHLAGELDGIEASRLLRERFDIPVVFLSGYADERTMTRAKLTGALGYLIKPFRHGELKSAVDVGLFRHQLERQLRARERWLATTLRAIGDAAIAVDPAGRITFMNSAAESLSGQREGAARGQPLEELFRLINEKTRAPLANPLAQALASGRDARLPPDTALVVGARELPVEYSVAPIIDERRTTLGAVAVIKDLTEERRAQQHITIADRLASLGAIAAGIAHEINNPLTYVLGNLTFMAEEFSRLQTLIEEKPAAEGLDELLTGMQGFGELLREVEEGATRVAHIVADLGVFARREPGPQRCNVVGPLEWALRVSHSAIRRHARVQRAFVPVPDVRVEEGRLGQIFLNLLLNAAYAMRDTDAATNELSVAVEPENPATKAGPAFVRVTIADTGVGMSADVVKRIFDPFFTTKPAGAGSGLGLSVCHTLVTQMGGDISVTSAPGQGSRFVVRLPVPDWTFAPEDGLAELEGRRGRVLIVDDDPRVLGVLTRMLSTVHEVQTSERPRAALELLRGAPAFDVILCDLLMPDMNGMEFYRQLAIESPELAARIIFVSGGAGSEQATEFFQGIPNTVLQKPPSRPELLRAIERQLGAASAAD